MKKLLIAVFALVGLLGAQVASAADSSANPGMHKHHGWSHSHHYAKGHRHHRHRHHGHHWFHHKHHKHVQ